MSTFAHFVEFTAGALALLLFIALPNWLRTRRARYFAPGSAIPRSQLPPSPGELRALIEVARGSSAKIAAHKLGLSARTVSNQLQSLFRKKRVSNITSAVCACLRDGDIALHDILHPEPMVRAAVNDYAGLGDPATGEAVLPSETGSGCMAPRTL